VNFPFEKFCRRCFKAAQIGNDLSMSGILIGSKVLLNLSDGGKYW
jgi:hypothetical protein